MRNNENIWFPDADFVEETVRKMVPVLFPNYDDGIPDFQYLGGAQGRGLLESALAQPQQTFFGEYLYPSIPDKAAALIWSITKNHAFNDGNKRAALTTGIFFLAFNNYILFATQRESVELCLKIAASEPSIDKEYVSAWISERIVGFHEIDAVSIIQNKKINRYAQVASAGEMRTFMMIGWGRILQTIFEERSNSQRDTLPFP